MIEDLISVIIPHYKVPGFEQDYLYQALDCLVRQTYKNFEVRITLDCPNKDYIVKTIELIENYRSKGLKIFLNIRQDYEPSIPDTRNTCIVSAKGEWFIFLDSDNWLDDNWLEVMHSKGKEVYPKIAFSAAENYNDRTGASYIVEGPLDHQWIYTPDAITKHRTKPLFGQVFLHRNHLEKVGFLFDPNIKIYETSLMMMKLIRWFRFTYVGETKIHTRDWAGAISRRLDDDAYNKKDWAKKAADYFMETK